MTHEEILGKVRGVLVDALALDEDDVTPDATLFGDLGAESIDILDIQFKLEQAFGFKIAQGEFFPEGVSQDPEFVREGKVTPKGIQVLRQKLPHVDFADFERDPQMRRLADIFTVDTVVRFVANKLNAGEAKATA
ncbi:MAG: phosphopantetheine-binding protein [Planctomycetota bacterium]|nr:phosphopantetheine-binding protein [Planctomycetota bacterium]